MDSRVQLTEDEIEIFNQDLELRRRFEEDHSVEIAEKADRVADAETEQSEIALEEQSEDDPFLKAELGERNAEVGEIPDAYPYNDLALNVSIIQERENKDWLEAEAERPPEDFNIQDSLKEQQEEVMSAVLIQDVGYFAQEQKSANIITQRLSDEPELTTVWAHGEITNSKLSDTQSISQTTVGAPPLNVCNIWVKDVTVIPILGPILSGLGALIGIVIFGGMAVLLAINVTWLFIAIVIAVVLYFWITSTAPERAARRVARKEAARRQAEELAKEKEARMELLRQQKEAEYASRRQLRIEIEQMPKYSNWKLAVYEKCGKRCEMCGETNGLEIHHRTSFDSILRAYKINTIAEAFECNELWNVNNGSVLCKKHHDEMKSSKYRQQM